MNTDEHEFNRAPDASSRSESIGYAGTAARMGRVLAGGSSFPA